MIRVHVFCEGQTEDVFVREVLSPYFQRLDVWLNPIVVRTSRHGRGGVTSYGKIKWQVLKKCREDANAWVTTLLDFYGLPADFPDADAKGSSIERAGAVERAFQSDIAQSNFLANLMIHEFEAVLFSEPAAFGAWFDDANVVHTLTDVRDGFDSPEHINDGSSTAPSKRILSVCGNYSKALHGPLIAMDIGLDVIRRECPLFNAWVTRLEGLAGGGGT